MLVLTDNQGIPIGCSHPIAGNHNDAFQLEKIFDKIKQDIEKSNLALNGVFLNADAGFDCRRFRKYCEANNIIGNIDYNVRNTKKGDNYYIFDELLYQKRFVVERTHAWLDAFKCLMTRFETKNHIWKSLWLLAFTIILIRKP